MHTHFSLLGAAMAFVGTIVIGTLWRLTAGYLCNSSSANLQHLGKAMAFQY